MDWDDSLIRMVQNQHAELTQREMAKLKAIKRKRTLNTILTILENIGYGMILFVIAYVEWNFLLLIFGQ